MRVAIALLIAATLSGARIAGQAAADDLARLQGVWTVTAAEQNGKPFDAIKGGVLTIADSTFFLRTAAGNELKGDLRINSAASPRQLDFVHADGRTVWEAIYTVSDEVLRLNYIEAGGRDKRPTLFATNANGPGTVIVMRRTASLAPSK